MNKNWFNFTLNFKNENLRLEWRFTLNWCDIIKIELSKNSKVCDLKVLIEALLTFKIPLNFSVKIFAINLNMMFTGYESQNLQKLLSSLTGNEA